MPKLGGSVIERGLSMRSMRRFQVVVLFIVVFWSKTIDAQIFADFDTSMGGFTCQLRHEDSPKAVANFIGLAEGSRPWIDPATGAVRDGVSYYAGVRFHRVVGGFMNQTGSRNGLGNDGPGYVFKDEVANGLSHDSGGILSMANSGKNTNGAQFFVTAASATHLDGKHTIFGFVTSGIGVVNAINGVPKSLNSDSELSVPVTPIILNSVVIRRVGPEAEAFDIDAQGLPEVSEVGGGLVVEPGVAATFVRGVVQPDRSIFVWYRSGDLKSWSKSGQVYEDWRSVGSGVATLDDAADSRAFYHLSEVKYTDGVIGPDDTRSHNLTVVWSGGTLNFQMDATGFSGIGSYNGGAFEILDAWLDESGPYRTTWIIETDDFGYLAVLGDLSERNGNTTTGTEELFQYGAFGWQSLGSGTLTLVHP